MALCFLSKNLNFKDKYMKLPMLFIAPAIANDRAIGDGEMDGPWVECPSSKHLGHLSLLRNGGPWLILV